MAQRYRKKAAQLLGWLNELVNVGQSAAEENMNFWNNYVGIKYGKKCKSRPKLADLLREAPKNGELITDIKDTRKHSAYKETRPEKNKQIVVLKQSKSGRNELFYDLLSGALMKRGAFVRQIESGRYPGYRVSIIHGVKTPVSKSDDSTGNNPG